jgi:hypothetical protein
MTLDLKFVKHVTCVATIDLKLVKCVTCMTTIDFEVFPKFIPCDNMWTDLKSGQSLLQETMLGQTLCLFQHDKS